MCPSVTARVQLLACVYGEGDDTLDALTGAHVERAHHDPGGNVSEVAPRHGLSRCGLQKKLLKWGIYFVPGGEPGDA